MKFLEQNDSINVQIKCYIKRVLIISLTIIGLKNSPFIGQPIRFRLGAHYRFEYF